MKKKNLERDIIINFRVSNDEMELITQKFMNSGLKTKGLFYRKSIMDSAIFKVDISEIKEHTKAIGKIGNNVNQIAAKVNSTGYVSKAEIEEITDMMKQIYDMERKFLQMMKNFLEG